MKSLGNRQLAGRDRKTRMKLNLREISYENETWKELVQHCVQCSIMYGLAVLNLRVLILQSYHLYPEDGRQYVPPSRLYPPTRLHGIITQKTIVRIFTAVKIGNLL
jgi:hypothetical protein